MMKIPNLETIFCNGESRYDATRMGSEADKVLSCIQNEIKEHYREISKLEGLYKSLKDAYRYADCFVKKAAPSSQAPSANDSFDNERTTK